MSLKKKDLQPSSFKPGDFVRVKYDHGCVASSGTQAIVVPHEEFPSYFKDLVKAVGEKDAYESFIAVMWVPSMSYPNKPEDGFYSTARFEKITNPYKG